MSITYLKGDATRPQTDGGNLIIHVCNDMGMWGAGFVMALSKRWARPEEMYRHWSRSRGLIIGVSGPFRLGETQLVQVEPKIYVANMVAQKGTGFHYGTPIQYDALDQCMRQVKNRARILNASVHMPRIGCGLAGGKWELVEPIIQKHLADRGIPTYVYDFEEATP